MDDVDDLRATIPEWALVTDGGIDRLRRVFRFEDFAQALAFTNAVAEIAEAENHHPAVLTEWGSVTVTWWTHVARGLTRNDFVMAARTDEVFGRRQAT